MPREITAQESSDLGRWHYEHRNFEAAVEAFTASIDATAVPNVRQYDDRAASYDKLQDFNSALKDGRAMIKANKSDVKGYLRTGMILQKVNKPEKALDIYKYGMKNVPVSNVDLKILQQLYDQLTRKLAPPKSIDPFTVLPVELARMVTGSLAFKDIVRSIRVSKGWKKYLTQDEELWMDLDLSGARKDVSRLFVRNAVKWSQYKVHRVVIHRFRHPDMLHNLASACINLTHLEILSGGLMCATIVDMAQTAKNLRNLVVTSEFTLDGLSSVLRSCPSLKHVEMKCIFASAPDPLMTPQWGQLFPNISTLVLIRQSRGNFEGIRGLIDKTPNLESLELSNWEARTDVDFSSLPLTHLKLNCFGGLTMPKLPRTVKQLTTHRSRLIWFGNRQQSLPELTHLSLEDGHFDISSYPDPALLAAGAKIGTEPLPALDAQPEITLEHLSIRGTTLRFPLFQWELMTIGRIFTPTLRHIDVSDTVFDDSACETLVTQFETSLHTIHFSKTQVTGAGVKILVDCLPTIKLLVCNNCPRITSRDIIEYAKGKGVEVSMRTTTSAITTSGRRVRYG